MSSRARQLAKEVAASSEGDLVDFLREFEGEPAIEGESFRNMLQRRVDSVVNGEATLLDFEESYQRLRTKFGLA